MIIKASVKDTEPRIYSQRRLQEQGWGSLCCNAQAISLKQPQGAGPTPNAKGGTKMHLPVYTKLGHALLRWDLEGWNRKYVAFSVVRFMVSASHKPKANVTLWHIKVKGFNLTGSTSEVTRAIIP